MNIEEAIEMLEKDKKQRGNCFISEALDMAIKALEQEPKTDRIEYGTDGNAYRLSISNGKEYEQEQNTGHWIMRHRKVNTINYRTGEDVLTGEIHTVKELIRYETDEPYCACCGKRAEDISQDYCGYCGARMEVEQNG